MIWRTQSAQRFLLLIDAPESKVPWAKLWVKDGSLLTGETPETLQPFRAASYVFYSINSTDHITETDTLPFSKVVPEIIELSASPEEDDWKRAKAELLVLYKQLLTTPDLTRDQANRYHADIVRQALESRERAKKIGTLSVPVGADMQLSDKSSADVRDALRAATPLLDLD